jgi:hypothetical protein
VDAIEIPDFDRIDAAAAQIQSADIVQMPGQAEPEAEAAAPEIPTSELLKPVLGMGFNILAPNWGVTEPEINELANAYGLLIDKYFPDGVLNSYGVEFAAIMTTFTVIAPRLNKPRKEKPKKPAGEVKQPEPAEPTNEQGVLEA